MSEKLVGRTSVRKNISRDKSRPTNSNWQVKSLSEVANVKSGFAFKSEDYLDEGIRLVRIGNLNGRRLEFGNETVFVDKKFLSICNDFSLKEGDVLIAMSGATIGKLAFVKKEDLPCLLNQRVGLVSISYLQKLNPKYLFYYLAKGNLKRSVLRIAGGSAQPNISPSKIMSFKIPLPPLPIQKQIAKILEKADTAKQKRKEANQLTDEFLQSVFIEMFGDPVKNPKGWKVKKFFEIAEIIMGQSPDGNSYNVLREGIPLLNGPAEFGENFPTEVQWTTQPTKFSKKGDLLFCVRGATAGRMNWSDKEYCIGRGLAAIRSNDKSKIEFIFHFLKLKYSQFQKLGQGSTFINLSKDLLSMMKIPFPPLSLQQQFAEIVNKTKALKEKQKQSEQELENLFQSLMQRAFKGELV